MLVRRTLIAPRARPSDDPAQCTPAYARGWGTTVGRRTAQRARLAAALILAIGVSPGASAASMPFYVLDALGMEAEAMVSFPVVGSTTMLLPKGDAPLDLTAGTPPVPPDFSAWRADPDTFSFSRGNAQRFAVGIGFVQAGTQQSQSASFQSVIRYQPPASEFTVKLKVDPLTLVVGFTGDFELAAPTISSLSLGFTSRFYANWFDMPAFRAFGPAYESAALISASGSAPLSAFESSFMRDAAGNPVQTFDDAVVFADQNSGFASIVAPAVERTLTFRDVPVTADGEFANLYLVYEMTVAGSIELAGGTTSRLPFLFAMGGDPIELESGNFRPSIEITPVPLGPALPFMLGAVGTLGYFRRRRQSAAASQMSSAESTSNR